jgi:hypothetical protein
MNTTSKPHAQVPGQPVKPWWRIGMVWLVLAGPMAVVVASLVTAAIAVDGAEEVLTKPVSAKALSASDAARLPAVQGRNHAATPRN